MVQEVYVTQAWAKKLVATMDETCKSSEGGGTGETPQLFMCRVLADFFAEVGHVIK